MEGGGRWDEQSDWMPSPDTVYVIAEAGVNHNGDLELARRLVDVAAQSGADAVKFQTFKAERLATVDAPKAHYQHDTTGGESQFAMLQRLELSQEDHHNLSAYCHRKGIAFISTPFDQESADFLAELDVPFFKVASPELTNLPLLSHIARIGKPMIVSTGASDIAEVAVAVRAIEETGNRRLVLLHCVSNYPADPADVNLRAMHTMARAFGVPVGFSDHTLGTEVAIAAVALGACVVEKHFTLDRTMAGPDQRASLEPNELTAMVVGIRKVEKAIGHGRKVPKASEADLIETMRKSLVAARDIPAGVTMTAELMESMRPGTGLPPSVSQYIVGRRTRLPIGTHQILRLDMFE